MTPDTQRIQQIINATDKTTLWEFLQAVPGSWEAQLFYAICIGTVIGALANYTSKFLKNETIGWCFIRYMLADHPKNTILSLFLAIGAGVAGITAGVFETTGGHFVGWFNVMWIAITNGFMADAIANKVSARQPTPSIQPTPKE